MVQLAIDRPDERLYFSFWLYTHESLAEHPRWAIEFVESTFDLGQEFGVGLQLVVQVRPLGKEFRRGFTPATWEWCKEELQNGGVWLALTHPRDFRAARRALPVWRLNMRRSVELRRTPNSTEYEVVGDVLPYVPDEITVAVQIPSAGRVSLELQERLCGIARVSLVRMKAAYGFINLSARPTSADVGGTVYERTRGLLGSDTTSRIDRVVRGAFWENFLGGGHIQALGGLRRVKASAPCARVEGLAGVRMLGLQLTEDVNQVTGDDVRKLEEYFQPVDPSLVGPAKTRKP